MQILTIGSDSRARSRVAYDARQDDPSPDADRCFATVAWCAVVGYAWQTFLGSRIEQCFGVVEHSTPAVTTTTQQCYADWVSTHPAAPLLDSPLFWLAALVVGFVAIWRVARA